MEIRAYLTLHATQVRSVAWCGGHSLRRIVIRHTLDLNPAPEYLTSSTCDTPNSFMHQGFEQCHKNACPRLVLSEMQSSIIYGRLSLLLVIYVQVFTVYACGFAFINTLLNKVFTVTSAYLVSKWSREGQIRAWWCCSVSDWSSWYSLVHALTPNKQSDKIEYEYLKVLWTSSFFFCDHNLSFLSLSYPTLSCR